LYDATQTVASVRRARKGELGETTKVSSSTPESVILLDEDELSSDEELLLHEEIIVPPSVAEDTAVSMDDNQMNDEEIVKDDVLHFPLPEDALLLQRIVQTVKNYPGDMSLMIGTMQVMLSAEGLAQIKELIG
jgi:hypothetical protein